jgi:hypothetical protein
VCGKTKSQKFMAGRYKNVRVLVRNFSELAAGLSEVENDGGLLFIKSILNTRRALAVMSSSVILRKTPFFFA